MCFGRSSVPCGEQERLEVKESGVGLRTRFGNVKCRDGGRRTRRAQPHKAIESCLQGVTLFRGEWEARKFCPDTIMVRTHHSLLLRSLSPGIAGSRLPTVQGPALSGQPSFPTRPDHRAGLPRAPFGHRKMCPLPRGTDPVV